MFFLKLLHGCFWNCPGDIFLEIVSLEGFAGILQSCIKFNPDLAELREQI